MSIGEPPKTPPTRMYTCAMISYVALIAMATSGQHNLNRGQSESYTFRATQRGHRIVVELKQANFRARGREIAWTITHAPAYYLPTYRVGNRDIPFLGMGYLRTQEEVKVISAEQEMERHHTELISLRVSVDARAWQVRQSLVRTIVDPDFGNEYVSASISRDGTVLNLSLKCSDGAGAYEALWTLRRSGLGTLRIRYLG